MSYYLVIIVSACYFGTALDFFFKGSAAWGVFWTGYAVSNLAFLAAIGAKP